MMPSQLIHGRPTAPVVRTLMETYGHERGTSLTHEQIADTIGEKRGTHRYRSIIGAWKKALLDNCGVLLVNLPNVGYEMVEANAQVLAGVRTFDQARRRVGRSVKIIAASPDSELSIEQRRAKIHALGVAAGSLSAMREAGKDSGKLLAALAPKK